MVEMTQVHGGNDKAHGNADGKLTTTQPQLDTGAFQPIVALVQRPERPRRLSYKGRHNSPLLGLIPLTVPISPSSLNGPVHLL